MSIQEISQVHASFDAKDCRPFTLNKDYSLKDAPRLMKMIGVGYNRSVVQDMNNFYASFTAMDSIQQPVLTPSILTPVQFLQNWLPGVVSVVTAKRLIDDLIGSTTAGSWEDEQIVQQIMEPTGTPVPYGDQTVIPLADYDLNFVTRDLVRFEQGMRVGPLEAARAARLRIDSAGQKRNSAALQLDIQRNAVGFYGYNNGANQNYGFLNDPNLPNYVTVANPGSGTTWSVKTFLQIQADILTAIQTLRTQTQEVVNPDMDPLTLAVATSSVDYLARTSDFGISVRNWLKQFYPNIRIVSAPQLNSANGGANVFYLYADSVNDGMSTDDGATFVQVVPARFQLLGVAKHAKGFDEDYSNATAGVLCKRPYAVVRRSGI